MRDMEVKPVDWLAMNIKKNKNVLSKADEIHNIFTERVKFKNFTSKYFKQIEDKLRNYIKIAKDNTLTLDLVILLIQNKPNIIRIQEAQDILLSIDYNELNIFLKNLYDELYLSIKNFLQRHSIKAVTYINWGIYNRCPLVCKGCYNIFNDDILELEECMNILDKIAESGAKKIILSGGDPLLWPHIIKFCEYAKLKDIKIGIDTVGYNLDTKLIKELSKLINHIGIPIDGSSQNIIEGFRLGKKDLFFYLKDAIKKMQDFNIYVRVNTTVSKSNINDLVNIANFINSHNIIKSWALYQWWNIRASDDLIKIMSVKDKTFLQKVEEIKKIVNINVHGRTVRERARSIFFISSNGEVYTFDETKSISTIIIGDIKTQTIKEILESPVLRDDSSKWNSY